MNQSGPPPITLRQLQYIIAVAEAGGFRAAAQRCHVAQPSLSAQIAVAEDALGVQLFERRQRPVLLTQAGQEIVRRARDVLISVEDLLSAAQRHTDPFGGLLRFGAIPTMAPYLLPVVDPALRQAFPQLTLMWTEAKTETLVAAITAGELDGALVALESDLGTLSHERLGFDPFVVAVGQAHPLAKRSSPIKMAALRQESVMLLDEGHCFRDQALELCALAGVKERGFRATSIPTLAQMVAGGGGVTLLPKMSLERENPGGQLAVLPFVKPQPGRTVVLGFRRETPLAAAFSEIAEVIRGELATLLPWPPALKRARKRRQKGATSRASS